MNTNFLSPLTIIFIGRSGAGKGTQVELLKKYLVLSSPTTPILEVETGKLFREFIAGSSYSSQRALAKNKAGERGASFLLVWLWTQFLVEHETGQDHLIFDGVSRSLIEGEALDTALTFYNRIKPIIIYLDVDNETATKRLTARGRADDLAPGGITKRLSWFESDVLPVVEYYRANPRYQFLDINGLAPMDEVHHAIISNLGV